MAGRGRRDGPRQRPSWFVPRPERRELPPRGRRSPEWPGSKRPKGPGRPAGESSREETPDSG